MKNITKTLLPAILGNTFEWYDFALYGFFSPIIAKTFFPTHNQTTSLLLTFIVFAMGFIIRPLGAVLLGHVGDTSGRKKALLISTLLMALPTTLMGLLPGYAKIGLWAPIGLVFLRCFQGLAVSGELSGASAFVIEHVGDSRRGLAGSIVTASVYAGQLLGSLFGVLASFILGTVALHQWGWRVPFLFSICFGVIIFILRFFSHETPKYNQHKKNNTKKNIPIKITLTQHLPSLIRIIGFVAVAAVSGYLLIGFLPTFLVTKMGFTLRQALILNTFSMALIMVLLPIIGNLSDRYGRKIFLLLGTIGFILLSYPIFYLFHQGTILSAILAEILYALCISCINGVITASMAEMLPTEVRFTGMGLGFNISLALFGGTAPLIAESLVAGFNSYYAAAGYLICCGVFSLPFIFSMKESYRAQLV